MRAAENLWSLRQTELRGVENVTRLQGSGRLKISEGESARHKEPKEKTQFDWTGLI